MKWVCTVLFSHLSTGKMMDKEEKRDAYACQWCLYPAKSKPRYSCLWQYSLIQLLDHRMIVHLLESQSISYCSCPDFLFRQSTFSLDWSEQFFQSTHPNNILKTIYAPASLAAFSGGYKIESAGKIWFMHELLCLLSKRRLFLCRWVALPKSAPWWPASLVSSLGILQDLRRTTSTPEWSNLLLCNCME